MENQKEAVIRVKNLTKTFGQRTVLKGISLDIYRGETLVIMGGSGCGKSTFLRHLIGSIRPDKGEIYFFGKDIVRAGREEMDEIRRKFGMLFQSGALFDSMTVAIICRQIAGLFSVITSLRSPVRVRSLVQHSPRNSDSFRARSG